MMGWLKKLFGVSDRPPLPPYVPHIKDEDLGDPDVRLMSDLAYVGPETPAALADMAESLASPTAPEPSPAVLDSKPAPKPIPPRKRRTRRHK